MVKHIDSTSDERTKNNAARHQYRILSDEEKTDMQEVKDLALALEVKIDSLMHKLNGREGHVGNQFESYQVAKRRAKEASMWAVRGLTG